MTLLRKEASQIQKLTDKLESVNNADLTLKELEQKKKKLDSREAELQDYRSKYEAQCKQQIAQANKERDAALRRAEEISSQCAKDNKVASDYKQKAKQEYEKYQELKQEQQALITKAAEKKVAEYKGKLKSDYDSKLSGYKKQIHDTYIAHEGYHIALAIFSLMVVLYHAFWLESFRNDLCASLLWIGSRLYDYISLALNMAQYLWTYFSNLGNLAATILGGIVLNLILIIGLFGGGAFGIIVLAIKGWQWFQPRFINKKTGYICLGILLGIVIFSDMIKLICPINLMIVLLIINIIVFVVRYCLKDYKEPITSYYY